MMAMPPIVGVPCLAMWCSGPRSSLPRIGWPRPRVRKAEIRPRVTNSDSTPPSPPAIMTAITRSDAPASSADATTSRSSNVDHLVADGLGRLVALAGDHHDVAGPGHRRSPCGSPPRDRAPPSTRRGRRRHAAHHVGDDGGRVLGTWVVRCHDDGVGQAGRRRRPSRGRFVRSRSPPQPNTTITRPAGDATSGPDDLLEAVGRVGVVDHDGRRRRRSPTRSNRPGTGAAAASPATIASTSMPSVAAVVAAASEFSTLKPPPSATSIRRPRQV